MGSDLRFILPFEVSNKGNGCEYLTSGVTTIHEGNDFRLFDDRDLMTKAPCHEKPSQLRLHSQMRKVHTLLNSTSNNPQKRKLHEHIDHGKFATTFDLIGKGKNCKFHKTSPTSSVLCSQLSKEKRVNLPERQAHVAFPKEKKLNLQEPEELVAFPNPNDILESCTLCTQDYSHLSSYHDFIEGPSTMKERSGKIHPKGLMDNSCCSFNIETTIREKPNTRFAKGLKFVNEDFAKFKTPLLLGSKEEEVELVDPRKSFLPSRGNHLSRPVIPVGPRFQADVPKWEGTTSTEHHISYDDIDLKWLGIEIWPMPIASKIGTKTISKDMPCSCSCDFPGSVDCVKKHVSEARKLLKLEIGMAFSTWKFDEMGEEVSKSWTPEEEMKFEFLVKFNPLSKETNFWVLAKQHFPSRSMKCLVNYYYNVYIPRRMSMETRSSVSAVDLDPK